MIRAIRHAARTGFFVEGQTYEAIFRNREEIRKCSPSRIRDEFLRELKEGVAEASLKLMLQTGLFLSLFPDLQRAFGDRNPLKETEIEFFLALFRLVDQLNKIGKPVQESILLALFLSPYLRVITTEHPFLEEWKRVGYLTQTIRWAFHQILNPFSFPKGTKEMAAQILIAQGNLKKSLRRGGIPKRLKMKTYFQEAVLFFGMEAQARGETVPRLLRHAVPSDLLPWWPKGFKRRRRRFSHSIPSST
jgi:poly(A) polymerase